MTVTDLAPSPPPSAPVRRRAPTWAVVTVLSLCGTAVSLQQTLVVPLLHEFAGIFDVSTDTASWLVTVTLLTSAVATPIVSRLADMFGKRRMMIVSLLAMTLGSLLAAIGGTFITALGGRLLQGFAASLIPIGISILRDELPKNRVSSAVALMSATLGIGGALGLPLSGLIYAGLGWQAIFWISAGVGTLLIAAVFAVVSESTVRTPGRFDYLGALLLSIALSCLLLAISKGGTWGWSSRTVIGLFGRQRGGVHGVGAVGIARRSAAGRPAHIGAPTAAAHQQLIAARRVRHVREPAAHHATVAGTRRDRLRVRLTITVAGLASIPSGLVAVIMAPISGSFINRFGGRLTLVVGAAIMSATYVARVFLSDSLFEVVLGSTLVGMGTAVAFAAMPTLVMASVPITETASANGLNSLVRAIGTSLSSATVAAVLGTLTMQVGSAKLPTFTAFQDVFWIAGIAALGSAVLAWYIPRTKVAARDANVRPAGDDREFVVRGSISRPDGKAPRPAVVTVLELDGTAVDWARADNDGAYSVVIPAPGRYLVVANAQGWTPRASVLDFQDPHHRTQLTLVDQLTLSGTVRQTSERWPTRWWC